MIVVTRQDMSPGYQAAQLLHASHEFLNEHPEEYQKWYSFSKAVTLLAVKNEDALKILAKQLTEKNIKFSIFIEPDINNQVTAIAIAPGETAYKHCSNIPLALKQFNSPELINKHSNLNVGKELAA